MQPSNSPQPPLTPPTQPLDLPPPSPAPQKNTTALAIAVIVAGVLLLAAAGIAAWLLTKKDETQQRSNTSQSEPQETVRSVTLVAPASLPASFQKREQNTDNEQIAYYYDSTTSCGLTTSVVALNEKNGTTPKDVVMNSVKAAESFGVTTAASKEGAAFDLKAAEGDKTYKFNTLELTQNVDIEGVQFKKQFNVITYTQVGTKVASIGYSCQEATWETQKESLNKVTQGFTVKTEK